MSIRTSTMWTQSFLKFNYVVEHRNRTNSREHIDIASDSLYRLSVWRQNLRVCNISWRPLYNEKNRFQLLVVCVIFSVSFGTGGCQNSLLNWAVLSMGYCNNAALANCYLYFAKAASIQGCHLRFYLSFFLELTRYSWLGTFSNNFR